MKTKIGSFQVVALVATKRAQERKVELGKLP
jgi:hypothetical protein